MNMKKDLFLCGVLWLLKLSILQEIEWWMVPLPLMLGFTINFISGFVVGFLKGINKSHEERKE